MFDALPLPAHAAGRLAAAIPMLAFLCSASPPLGAAPTDSSVTGRLSCTTASEDLAPKSEGLARNVSCTYEPVAGQPAKLEGTIGRSQGEAPGTTGAEKRVFVWTVHGPPSLAAQDLAGLFKRTVPPPPAVQPGFDQALVSADGAIALMPLSGSDQFPGNAAVTILELTLSAMRV